MKIHIKRQGIVIRTVEIRGDKASVGSGAECEIRVDDPYLGAHVADIVNRGGEWRIIDKATSLEGISHNGRRVEDEPLVSGAGYTVGAFELVAEGAAPGHTPAPPAQGNQPVSQRTMMQDFDDGGGGAPVPRTLFEAPVPGGIPGASQQPVSQFQPQAPPGFQSMNAPPQQRPAMPAAAPGYAPVKRRSKLPLLLAGCGLMIVVVLIVALMLMGGGGDQTAETSTIQTPTPTPTPVVIAVNPVEQGNQFAANLEIDKALQSWEAAIQAGGNDPLRAKYAKVAYDAAMVHAAANDTARSRSYLERVVKFGPADSPEVMDAKARMGS